MALHRHRLESSRFELLSRLGAGAMGTVYEAKTRGSEDRVAIKFLNQASGKALLRFKHEFRVLSELAHPNVVRFGELFEEDGKFYFTMELIRGDSFLEYVRPGSEAPRRRSRESSPQRRSLFPYADTVLNGDDFGAPEWSEDEAPRGTLDVRRLRHVLSQLCSGLLALHAAGLVHRDVKPQNVMIANGGRLVLLDFGLVLNMAEPSDDSEIAGTFAYMAPEQARSGTVGPSADWYAVGVMLYEALTGCLPAFGDSGVGLIPASRGREAASEPGSDAPQDLLDFARALMSRDPRDRPDEEAIASYVGLEVHRERARLNFRSRIELGPHAFVGRERERAVLADAVARVESGGSAIVRIVGASGIGKSSLVRQCLRDLEARDWQTLVSRCSANESVPYRGLDGIMDEIARQLSREDRAASAVSVPPSARLLATIFPVLRAVPEFESYERGDSFAGDPQEARKSAFAGVRDILGALAAEKPLVVHVDDVHRIDPESIALLEFLQHAKVGRILMILTERPSRDAPLAEFFARCDDLVELELPPLTFEQSRALMLLLAAQRAAVPLERLDDFAAKSGGHPLFIHELMLHTGSDGAAATSLEAAVNLRIEALEASARRVLEIVALASAPLSHRVLRAAARIGDEEYPWLLSALRTETLISSQALDDRERVEVYHDRIRELVLDRVPPVARRATHLAIAESLERHAATELDALAYHFHAADAADRARSYARSAAESAVSQLAFEKAARLYELALDGESNQRERRHLAERMGFALASAGHGVEAASAYLRSAELTTGEAALELRRRAGEQLLRAGHIERGTEILFELLSSLGVAVPGSDLLATCALVMNLGRIRVRGIDVRERAGEVSALDRLRLDTCWTVATGLSIVHHIRSTEFQTRTLLLALDAGDRERALRVAAGLGATLSMAEGTTRDLGERLRKHAEELARGSDSVENEAWLELMRGITHMADWDFASCRASCERAEAKFRSLGRGATWEVVTAQAFELWSTAFRGDLAGLRARLPELVAAAHARGDRHALAMLTLSPLHLVWLANDEPEDVRRQCRELLAEWPVEVACFQHQCGEYILAHADMYEGRYAAAWEHVCRAMKMLRRGHMSRVQFQRIDLTSLRARAALGFARVAPPRQRRAWISRVAADARRLAAEGRPAATALSALVSAGVAIFRGAHGVAVERLASAAELFDGVGMGLHAATARYAQAILLGDELRRDEADAELAKRDVQNPASMLNVWLPGCFTLPPD